MGAERAHAQAEHDGRAIDQGIFCAAVLRSDTAGAHLIDAMLLPTPRSLELIDDFRATGRAELGSVSVERRGAAAHVTFRNAHSLNAEDDRLIADLDTAADLVLLDDRVRVGVLRGGLVDHPSTGAGGSSARASTSGPARREDLVRRFPARPRTGLPAQDAAGRAHRPGRRRLGRADRAEALDRRRRHLRHRRRHATAAGARPGDRGVGGVSEPARGRGGIVPGLGNLRLTRLTGARLARQVVLSGRRIRATDPEAPLLCDEVVPADGMDEAVERAVAELSAPPWPRTGGCWRWARSRWTSTAPTSPSSRCSRRPESTAGTCSTRSGGTGGVPPPADERRHGAGGPLPSTVCTARCGTRYWGRSASSTR
ncbi:hypothetical protein NKH77_54935 [Streptomyces sp. M19]